MLTDYIKKNNGFYQQKNEQGIQKYAELDFSLPSV